MNHASVPMTARPPKEQDTYYRHAPVVVMLIHAALPAGGGDDKAVVMVMCNRQEWLVDLVREPGKLLPLRPDTVPQAPYLNRLSGHASGSHTRSSWSVCKRWHVCLEQPNSSVLPSS